MNPNWAADGLPYEVGNSMHCLEQRLDRSSCRMFQVKEMWKDVADSFKARMKYYLARTAMHHDSPVTNLCSAPIAIGLIFIFAVFDDAISDS